MAYIEGGTMDVELPSGEILSDPTHEVVSAAIRGLRTWEDSVVLRDSQLGELSLSGPENGLHYVQCSYSAGRRSFSGERTGLPQHELIVLSEAFLAGRSDWREGMDPIRSLAPRSGAVLKGALVGVGLLVIGWLVLRAV